MVSAGDSRPTASAVFIAAGGESSTTAGLLYFCFGKQAPGNNSN